MMSGANISTRGEGVPDLGFWVLRFPGRGEFVRQGVAHYRPEGRGIHHPLHKVRYGRIGNLPGLIAQGWGRGVIEMPRSIWFKPPWAIPQ